MNESNLDEINLKKATFTVKPGYSGASLFVKNLACAVFGEGILLKSSLTGSKCNAKKDAVARLALCPERLNYIKSKIDYISIYIYFF